MRVKKSLGQHFLTCAWVAETMVSAAALSSRDTALEIGPGTGTLTRLLAKKAKRVVAVEKDEALARKLRDDTQRQGMRNVEIIEGDILHFLSRPSRERKWNKVVANIPYYLTSRLVRLLLENKRQPELVVLTIQKEVAERMAARPPRMNLLAVGAQAFGAPKIIKRVSASCFSPKPAVDSAIMKISDISREFFSKNGIDEKEFFTIVRRAFSQKRKILSNTLKGARDTKTVSEAIKKAGIGSGARAQELSLDQWAKLYRGLSSIVK